MNSPHHNDKGFSTDNAEVLDKSHSDKDNITRSSAVIQEPEISDRSYEDLSLEFQRLYPSAVRAFELIPLMYNRLTLVDKLSHKEAFTKICDDHKHLSGFSTRNISRYLPSDNPSVPRRVRTSCPKNSFAETSDLAKLSVTQHEEYEAALLLEKQKIQQDLIRKTPFVNDDETPTNEIKLTIPKVKFENVKAAMENSSDFVYLIFDKSGILERVESDALTDTKK